MLLHDEYIDEHYMVLVLNKSFELLHLESLILIHLAIVPVIVYIFNKYIDYRQHILNDICLLYKNYFPKKTKYMKQYQLINSVQHTELDGTTYTIEIVTALLMLLLQSSIAIDLNMDIYNPNKPKETTATRFDHSDDLLCLNINEIHQLDHYTPIDTIDTINEKKTI